MIASAEGGYRMEKDRHEAARRIEITGTLDRHALEALQLEIRRLAKLHGVEITGLQVKRMEKGSSPKVL
jgi:hypothetical protein